MHTARSLLDPITRALFALWIAGLAACSTLPTIHPDMAQPKAPLQLSAANGRMLTPRQSEAIIERLRRDGKGSDVLERHLALEEAIADSPLSVGNHVVLLQDGPATYAAMFAAIRNARDHINLETYILDDDDIGRRFADALVEKQHAGVQVNLIVDSVGTLRTPRAFFERLTVTGIRVLEFNPVNPLNAKAGWNVNQRDHRKLLVVDGQIAFLGGINISSVYSGSASGRGSAPGSSGAGKLPWRDTHMQIEGPVVADFQRLFMQTWARQKAEPLGARNYFPPLARRGNAIVRAIGSAPSDPFSAIYATFISAIHSAEREVLLTNAYFVPDPQLVASLIGAVGRGVDVRIIVPSTTDSWLVFRAGRSHYDELLQGGVKIYERRDALLHSKTAVIDGVWSTVGSTNLDWRSFLHNQEVNAVVLGADFGNRMREAFARDLEASGEITLENWRKRPPSVRMKEWIGRIWGYWL